MRITSICDELRSELHKKNKIKPDAHVYFLLVSLCKLDLKTEKTIQELKNELYEQHDNFEFILHQNCTTFPLNFNFNMNNDEFISMNLNEMLNDDPFFKKLGYTEENFDIFVTIINIVLNNNEKNKFMIAYNFIDKFNTFSDDEKEKYKTSNKFMFLYYEYKNKFIKNNELNSISSCKEILSEIDETIIHESLPDDVHLLHELMIEKLETLKIL